MNICPYCGNPLDESNTCPVCGVEIPKEERKEHGNMNSGAASKGRGILVAVVVFILFLLFGKGMC